MDIDLRRLKSDAGFLDRVYVELGGALGHDRGHLACVLCGSSDAFSLHERKDQAQFKCHVCGEGGSVLDLLAKAKGLPFKDVLALLKERYADALNALPGKPAVAHRKKGAFFPSAVEAEEFLARVLAKPDKDGRTARLTAGYVYEDLAKSGEFIPCFKVLRFDFVDAAGKPDGKQCRPIHRVTNGWRIGLSSWGKARKCPLYRAGAIEKAIKEFSIHG